MGLERFFKEVDGLIFSLTLVKDMGWILINMKKVKPG